MVHYTFVFSEDGHRCQHVAIYRNAKAGMAHILVDMKELLAECKLTIICFAEEYEKTREVTSKYLVAHAGIMKG